jgi:cbb3-type cytochrome oxidase subunit 3
MKSVVLRNFDMTDLTIVGLLLFSFLFLSVVFWVFRRNSKKFYKQLSNNILKDEIKVGKE